MRCSVPDKELSPVRRALFDFSGGQADHDRVLRALAEHEEWLAPTLVMYELYGRDRSQTLYEFGGQTDRPPGKFLLFTDFEAARTAQAAGIPLGPFSGGIAGHQLFSNISPDWAGISINAGSAR